MGKCVLVVGMNEEPGGVETFLMRVLNRLVNKGMRFDALTFSPRCAFEEELEALGVNVYHVARRGKKPLKSYSEARRFFKAHGGKYDAVWLHLSSASHMSAVKLAKRYTKARLIGHSHSVSFESKGGAVRAAHMLLHRLRQKKLARLLSARVAVSKEAALWMYGTDEGAKIVPNGVDTEAFYFDEKERRSMRESLNVEGKTVLGHIGRLVPVKNQGFLLELLHELLKTDPNAVLLIAGEGALKNDLMRHALRLGIADHVRFFGFSKNVRGLLQAFDVFLLPSLFEGFPLVLCEALACALPFVASSSVPSSAFTTELAQFCPLDKAAWIEAIQKALRLPRDAHGARAVLESAGLTLDVTVSRIKALLQEDQA